ncbi:hypothetical protein GCM10010400_50090 [Streptomyces aculeolatus]
MAFVPQAEAQSAAHDALLGVSYAVEDCPLPAVVGRRVPESPTAVRPDRGGGVSAVGMVGSPLTMAADNNSPQASP